jgi:hypothetical protein
MPAFRFPARNEVWGYGHSLGPVTLEDAVTHAKIDIFTLDSSGNFSGTTTFLPGGSYSVVAHYGGDGNLVPAIQHPKPLPWPNKSARLR